MIFYDYSYANDIWRREFVCDISFEKEVREVMRCLGIKVGHPHYDDLTQTATLAFYECKKKTSVNVRKFMKHRCIDLLRKERLYENRHQNLDGNGNGWRRVSPCPIVIKDLRLKQIWNKLNGSSGQYELPGRDRVYLHRNRYKLKYTLELIELSKTPLY